MERHGPRGGGNRHEVRDVVRGANLAAKQLGSKAAKVGRHYYADNAVFNSPLATPHSLKKSAYTLAEIIIVLVVIAVVVAATMRVAKTRLDNITTYTYYAAYSVLNDVTAQMLADYSPSRNEYTDVAFIKRFLPFVQSKEVLAGVNDPLFSEGTYTMYGCAQNKWYMLNSDDYDIENPFHQHVWLYGSVFIKNKNKCVAASDADLNLNPNKYVRCSGKRILYRSPEVDKYDGRYKYSSINGFGVDLLGNREVSGTAIYANTYSREGDTCSYSCDNGSNNCGFFNEYTDYHCVEPTNWNSTFGTKQIGLSKDGNEATIFVESYSGYYARILSSTMLEGNVCKYEIKCKEDTEAYTSNFPANFGSLSGKSQTLCEFKCDGDPNYEQLNYDFNEHKCIPRTTPCQQPSGGCSAGSVWRGEPTCSCVPEPPTIPRKGINFCNMFVSLANTKAGTMCQGGAVAANTTDFSDITEDIILRNGMKIYNASQNPASIADLVGNDTGGTVTKTDGTTFDTNIAGYTLYVDIDGSSGNSKLWEDVFPFYVTLSGKVIPAYKTDALGEFGGDSRYYMQTSIQVDAVDSVGATQYWLLKSKSFKESACKAGYVGQNTLYCSRHDATNPAVNQDAICSQEQNSCSVKKVSPIRGF